MPRGRGREATQERGWRERTSESGDVLTRLDFKTTKTQRRRELYVIKRRFWRKYLEHIEILLIFAPSE